MNPLYVVGGLVLWLAIVIIGAAICGANEHLDGRAR